MAAGEGVICSVVLRPTDPLDNASTERSTTGWMIRIPGKHPSNLRMPSSVIVFPLFIPLFSPLWSLTRRRAIAIAIHAMEYTLFLRFQILFSPGFRVPGRDGS